MRLRGAPQVAIRTAVGTRSMGGDAERHRGLRLGGQRQLDVRTSGDRAGRVQQLGVRGASRDTGELHSSERPDRITTDR